jgi:hypothetical protein
VRDSHAAGFREIRPKEASRVQTVWRWIVRVVATLGLGGILASVVKDVATDYLPAVVKAMLPAPSEIVCRWRQGRRTPFEPDKFGVLLVPLEGDDNGEQTRHLAELIREDRSVDLVVLCPWPPSKNVPSRSDILKAWNAMAVVQGDYHRVEDAAFVSILSRLDAVIANALAPENVVRIEAQPATSVRLDGMANRHSISDVRATLRSIDRWDLLYNAQGFEIGVTSIGDRSYDYQGRAAAFVESRRSDDDVGVLRDVRLAGYSVVARTDSLTSDAREDVARTLERLAGEMSQDNSRFALANVMAAYARRRVAEAASDPKDSIRAIEQLGYAAADLHAAFQVVPVSENPVPTFELGTTLLRAAQLDPWTQRQERLHAAFEAFRQVRETKGGTPGLGLLAEQRMHQVEAALEVLRRETEHGGP